MTNVVIEIFDLFGSLFLQYGLRLFDIGCGCDGIAVDLAKSKVE